MANPEKNRERASRWAAANRERTRENSRRWRAANPEYQRCWRAANTEKVREYGRCRRAANPEKWREWVRRWRAANPENVRAWVRRRLAIKLGAAHIHYTEMDLDLIYRSQGGLCLYCGKKIERRASRTGTHLDHMVPLSRGGPDSAANIAFACATCNIKKNDMAAEEWYTLGAAVPQLAEGSGSNPVQCRFDSDAPYQSLGGEIADALA